MSSSRICRWVLSQVATTYNKRRPRFTWWQQLAGMILTWFMARGIHSIDSLMIITSNTISQVGWMSSNQSHLQCVRSRCSSHLFVTLVSLYPFSKHTIEQDSGQDLVVRRHCLVFGRTNIRIWWIHEHGRGQLCGDCHQIRETDGSWTYSTQGRLDYPFARIVSCGWRKQLKSEWWGIWEMINGVWNKTMLAGTRGL